MPKVHRVCPAALCDYAQPPPPILEDQFQMCCHDFVTVNKTCNGEQNCNFLQR